MAQANIKNLNFKSEFKIFLNQVAQLKEHDMSIFKENEALKIQVVSLQQENEMLRNELKAAEMASAPLSENAVLPLEGAIDNEKYNEFLASEAVRSVRGKFKNKRGKPENEQRASDSSAVTSDSSKKVKERSTRRRKL